MMNKIMKEVTDKRGIPDIFYRKFRNDVINRNVIPDGEKRRSGIFLSQIEDLRKR